MDKFSASLVCAQCDQPRRLEDLTICSSCGTTSSSSEINYLCVNHCQRAECGHARYCNDRTHQTCWDSHIATLSRRLQAGHQKNNALKDKWVRLILYSEADDEAQRKLHEADQKHEWFRVTLPTRPLHGDLPILQISRCFEDICTRWSESSTRQYPSFVSFVGDTGVGKSTLVRAMITVGAIEEQMAQNTGDNSTTSRFDMAAIFDCQQYGPVTRSGNPERAAQPTSVGVHLYRDPNKPKVVSSPINENDAEHVPILFADCEGFRGGSALTNAMTQLDHLELSSSTPGNDLQLPSNSSELPGMRRRYEKRRIEITAPDFKTAQKESAELFYARFLYAFSDVVVFVTSEDQKLNDDMRRLLEWALSAVKKSVGRKSPKTLIVVRNGPKLHDERFYDNAYLKRVMFNDFGNLWELSPALTQYKIEHDNAQTLREEKIHDNNDFFAQFFNDTKMCYIPRADQVSKIPPDEIFRQYQQLRILISEGTTEGQRVRSNSLSRYHVPAVARLLDRAFDHFSNSNEPFDFYTAARKDNPTPISIPGHIANLLRHMRTTRADLNRFTDIVACCLLTYVYRTFDLAREPEEIFEKHLKEKCRKGLEIYQDKFQRCNLIMNDGTRCTNVRVKHVQHLSEKNQRSNGTIDLSEYEENPSDTLAAIRRAFIDVYHEVFSNSKHRPNDIKPLTERMTDTRRKLLRHERLIRTGTLDTAHFSKPMSVWTTIKSNKTCFGCLQFAPDHVLVCGHGFCDDCIKDFGHSTANQQYQYHVPMCVLCGTIFEQTSSFECVRLHPRCAGIRLLTLDGGGIRGIIELAILEKIEARVALPVPMRDLVDLIVGTSTGGIIALALAMAPPQLSLQDLRQRFLQLARKTFEYDRFGVLWNLDFLKVLPKSRIALTAIALRLIPSRYESEKLKGCLIELFGNQAPLFGSTPKTKLQRATRVAVTSTNGGSCILSNYSRLSYEKDESLDIQAINEDDLLVGDGLEREDDPSKEAKIWEAGMCTSAAPSFFRPWRLGDPRGQDAAKSPFVDGALHSNLPVVYALEETLRIWPAEQGTRRLDTLVSIGTGRQNDVSFAIPKWIDVGGAGEVAKFFENTTNTDKAWSKFQASSSFRHGVHHRLTVDLDSKVDLDDWQAMEYLYNHVNSIYDQKATLWHNIEDVAFELTAGLFYFEPDEGVEKATYDAIVGCEVIPGSICCRLESPSAAFSALMSRVFDGFWLGKGTLNPTRLSVHYGQPWRTVQDTLIRSQSKFALRCQISSAKSHHTEVQLMVALRASTGQNRRLVRISGFPITFSELKESLKRRGPK